jgi:hypothetical protein
MDAADLLGALANQLYYAIKSPLADQLAIKTVLGCPASNTLPEITLPTG